VLLVWRFLRLEVNVADNSKLLMLGAAGAAVWWFYLRKPSPAAVSPFTEVVPVVPVVPKAPAAPSVSDIQAAVILAAKPPAEGLPVDSWGWYLNQVLAPLGKTAPDPVPLFSALMATLSAATGKPLAFERSMLVATPQYWSVMAPALKSQLGLSGLGMYRMVR
jgi:hypothetical protein